MRKQFVSTLRTAALVALALSAVPVLAGPPAQQTVGSGGAVGAGGRRLAIDDLRGQVAVLAFGGTLDPQSPDLLPVLQRLVNRYGSRGVQVFWVSLDSEQRTKGATEVTDAALDAYGSRYGFSGTILRDPDGTVFRSFATGRRPQLPTIVVLDQSGTVVGSPITGFDRDSDVVNQLGAVLDRLTAR